MRIVTWNVNGIRASNKSTSIKTLLESLCADIVCFQETKITRNLLTSDIGNINGYLAFFSFSRKKGGYSGVVTYCKTCYCPVAAEEGLAENTSISRDHDAVGFYNTPEDFTKEYLTELDTEGRSMITEHEDENGDRVCIVNVYCPMAIEENEERYAFKLNFYKLLEARCRALRTAGKHVVVVGDLNVAHRRIDHCEPGPETFDASRSRRWFDSILYPPLLVDRMRQNESIDNQTFDVEDTRHCENNDNDVTVKTIYGPNSNEEEVKSDDDSVSSDSNDTVENIDRRDTKLFVDLFRLFHPHQKQAYTCWNTKTRARETNYGTRIDYILASFGYAVNGFLNCDIRPDILGSDHCPVEACIKTPFVKSAVIPSCCAIFMPECCGKQREIKSYFLKSSPKREQTFDEEKKTVSCKRRKISNPETSNLMNYFGTSFKNTGKKNKEKTGRKEISTNRNVHLNCLQSNIPKTNFENVNRDTNSRSKNKSTNTSTSWKNIFKGPEPPPTCTGHGEPSVLRTVKKEGPNLGRQFYVCNKPAGHPSNKEARCNFFKWKTK